MMINSSLTGPGNLIKGRWKILRKIGQGAFGEIYSGRNVVTSELVAIKVERVDSKKQVLKLEVAVLKKLQSAGCPYVVTFITCGRHNDYNYMVMELLGENISELRRHQPNGRFSMTTTLKLGIQMLRAIEAVHDLGYLHRDIKPSNYAMGLTPAKRHSCYLIDFGLARRYLLPNGEVRPARDQTGFRGTARYASINSHQSKDLSRRDDLWSLLYVLIEFAKGQLPWRRIKDKDQVGEMKITYDNPELVSELPQEFLLFMQHLQTIRYGDRPNYSFLNSLMTDLYHRVGGDDATPFDWERAPARSTQRPRPIPSLFDLCFLKVATNLNAYSNSRIPYSAKKRMLDFLIRINNGKWISDQMNRLLDKHLQEIDLANCVLDEEDFRNLTTTCTKLRALTLGSTTDAMIKELVTKNPNIEQLSFTASKLFTSRGVKLIAENCTKLQVLKLKNAEKVSDKSVELILRSCTSLIELCLSGCKKVKGSAFKPYGSSSSSSSSSSSGSSSSRKRPLQLLKLDLSNCELNKSGFKTLAKMASCLQALYFSPLATGFKITASEFSTLIHNCTNLLVLDLSNYHFEMDTILIEVSRSCTQLTTLLLDGIGMTDYGLQNVVQYCTRLETLRFRYGDGVTDASLTQIAKSCSSLKSLTLDFWNKFNRLSVSDQAIKNLLQSCTNLSELSLCNCLVLTGACFPESGYFPNLQFLNLSECIQLNDFAIRRITESCPALKHLELNNLNNLTPASLEAVAMGCPLLEELYLKQCACFLDESMKSLLKVMPKLFLHVTRYTDPELKGNLLEVHSITVDKLFDDFPNVYRERAFERTRKRMFGMEG
eukprot:TRINITY_DN9848_c0_g1_i1.p1 TRINITY_DN9848_c0_g1~~TRINITY_DN9848_c0_g1_i1.p1  ORF type:complete len:827 (+),score=356.27 TRINITY_DN9848_c0_g1_i1:189-2669(+)